MALLFFFFSSRRRHTRWNCDWSSDVCSSDLDGQLLNGNMADYLVPMAGEMPDIVCAHLETPTQQSQLGAKGVGEAGTAGAPGAIMNAINDALSPFNARVTAM